MATNKLLATLLLAVVSAAAAAGPHDEVRCRETSFSRSAENRDIDAFRAFLDADARFVGGRVLRGPEEIVSAWQAFFADDGPEIKWRPQFVEVLDDGTLALTRGPYRTISRSADGDVVERWGTFNSVWRVNDDGTWLVVFDAGSPAESPPDDATRALLDQEDDCR